VDFEPAGKDHHSEGGSVDTGKKIVKEVYGFEPPVSFQYDFVRIKGRGGKISSSSGEVVSLRDVLEVYQPEIVRYLFAGTRPNSEFAISFDLDVIKIYEDYDRTERIYFGAEEVSEKRREKEKRIYELSQIERVPERLPYQAGFRHLCNLLQINEGNVDRVLDSLRQTFDVEALDHVRARARCGWNWITQFAPESFRFHLKPAGEDLENIDEKERAVLKRLKEEIESHFENHEDDEKRLSESIYGIAQELDMVPKDLFKLMYRILIGKEMGPRLAAFLLGIGRERILAHLSPYMVD